MHVSKELRSIVEHFNELNSVRRHLATMIDAEIERLTCMDFHLRQSALVRQTLRRLKSDGSWDQEVFCLRRSVDLTQLNVRKMFGCGKCAQLTF